jgi:uncharacterized membrane protein
MSSARTQSFSDGVFAVAITLLIFNLLPVGRGALSYRSLGAAWPQYAAYVVSFLSIGIMWMNHHTLFGHVNRVDRPLLVLNLTLLMGVVAIPFPTALIAEHLTGPNASGGPPAAVVYGIVMVVIALCYNAIWGYLVRHAESLGSAATRQQLREAISGLAVRVAPGLSIPRWSAGLAGYLAGTLIAAFVSAGAALAVYGGLAVFYLFEHLPDPAAMSASPPADPGNPGDHA